MSFSAPTSRAQRSRRILPWLLYLYALVLFAMHFVRIFDNSFWGDEGFSIGLAQMNVFEMLQVTAQITIRRCTIFSRNSYIIFWAITDMSIICRL
mgnify:CR=1 FL=1